MEPIPYRFYITGRSGTREAFPKNGNALAIKWQSENENAYLRKQLTGKILFTNEDFDFLYYLEKSVYRCESVDLRIENNCGGQYQTYITSKLIFSKGTWDIDRRTVQIEPTVSDLYTCYDDNSDVDYNLFSYLSERFSVSSLQGTIETVQCNGSQWCGFGTDPFEQGYTILSQTSQFNTPPNQGGGPDQGETDPVTQTIWIREVKSFTQAPPLPWVNIDVNLYAKPPVLFDLQQSTGPDYSYYTYRYGAVFDNGLGLQSIFQTFINLSCYGYTLKSDFFQWNPDNATGINYVTGQLSKVTNLKLFQKSDIKRPDADNNATIATTNFSDLLKDICNIFNLKWWIDENNNFRIEHISFNTRLIGINSITRYDADLRAGTNKYSYDNDNLPRKEVFTWMDSLYGEFAGLPIMYNNECAGLGNSNNGDVSISKITTDVEFLLQNPKSDSSAASDDGFCLIACDDEGNIISEAPILGGNSLNNTLAWSHLHVDYWRYGRPFHQFIMNGQVTLAESVKATKKQTGLVFKFCCGDHFNPDELITTPLGNGQVDNPTINLYKNELTLDLLYEADITLSNNSGPVAVADEASTFMNLPIIIDVLANDSDPDGTIANQTLAILLNPANGTAEITPDFKIKYIPGPGFVGLDTFIYQVSDNLQEPSNNGVVNITVKPGSPLPIANTDNYIIGKNKVLTVAADGILSNDTGDGLIQAIPENKSTTQGTVIIYANGSFVYTPNADYVGADIFPYTMKDSNNNQTTGSVNINVFEPEPVYVSLIEQNEEIVPISRNCNGIISNSGSKTTVKYLLNFFSDELGSIPLNVNGYQLSINLEVFISEDGSLIDSPINNSPEDNLAEGPFDLIGSGESMVVSEKFLKSMNHTNCDGSLYSKNAYIQLNTGNYTII